MKTSRTMQEMVTQLAQKHGLDLTAPEGYLRLDMAGFDRLVIEKTDQNLVKVAHYYEQKGRLIADPEVIFFTANGIWIPIEITQVLGGRRAYAVPTPDGQSIVLVEPRRQESLADFVEIWVDNIKSQRWLEDGEKWDPCDPRKTTPPDEETLIRWEAEGGCEAIDGCWTEPDGRCEHGCPSWLLALGFI